MLMHHHQCTVSLVNWSRFRVTRLQTVSTAARIRTDGDNKCSNPVIYQSYNATSTNLQHHQNVIPGTKIAKQSAQLMAEHKIN